MRIESMAPVPPVEPSNQGKTAELAAGQNGHQHAFEASAEASQNNVVRVLMRDGKTIVYQTVDQKGELIEQVPSEQILALREHVANLLQAAEEKNLNEQA
jgi:hypothetical protein